MPRGYEEIRDKLHSKGLSLKEAKKHAAMIWNSNPAHKGNTVGKGRK